MAKAVKFWYEVFSKCKKKMYKKQCRRSLIRKFDS